MTWDQVKYLNQAGFDIGAHTRTHADLGQIDEAAARDEIFGARHDLERRLRRPIDLFAYPYGRLDNMRESNRALVRAAGFRCCCSCYGGLTPRGADPFRLQRLAVSHWYDTPHQFGMELLRETGTQAAPQGGRCSEISAAIGY
jgi:peptidoglycan/xylan/chitin deacetylase (PgdA/CDA1 family)